MSRPLRVSLAGMTYHVMSRGKKRRKIFVDDEDKERFIEYLVRTKDRFGVVLYAFVLMDNHVLCGALHNT